MKIEKTLFGTLPDGRGVDKYTLTNKAGASVSLLSYGGIVNSIIMPDRDGNLDEIACGFDDIDSYEIPLKDKNIAYPYHKKRYG